MTSSSGSNVLTRIGTLTSRLSNRLGRDFGNCHRCRKPTRSHAVADGVECHTCRIDRGGGLVADGGRRESEVKSDREAWATLLARAEPPTWGEVRRAVAEADLLDVDNPGAVVDDALGRGVLVKQDNGGAFTTLALADQDGAEHPDAVHEDADETPRERGLAAFEAAISYFNNHLDDPIHPDEDTTAREHLREHRGWSDETIHEKRLGFAPANGTGLLDHLMGQGFGREAILETGLFWDDLSPIWKGRIVLPYLDHGQPVFAISRSVGHPVDDAGVYAEDDDPAKYHKIPRPDERAVYEPIYGLDSVETGEPVIVTEGIADAVTAHQAGYTCVSPVTTTFKKGDRDRLVHALNDAGVTRVYVVQDAERPGSDLNDDDTLALAQYGEGERGAVSTAAFLDDAGIDTYLGELPRPGLGKVDLDDYLLSWGDLDPVLASAKPAGQHPAYNPASDDQDRDDPPVPAPNSGDERRSALFDLDLVDVVRLDAGERGTNPLGHHGDSENYYVVARDGETAYDHKYKSTYTAATHLLVDAGERSADDPEGELSDREIFAAWKTAKAAGALGIDDPVPYRGLRGVAVADGLIDEDQLVHRDSDSGRVVNGDDADTDTYLALPSGVYDETLAHVENTYGVDPGRDPVEGDDDRRRDAPEQRDLLELDVVVEPANALAAAAAVKPSDLDADADLPELEREDIDDIAIAVALAEGWIDSPSDFPSDGRYTQAYHRARDRYGAPLPKYLDNTTLEERDELVIAALNRVRPEHVLDSCRSEVTVDNPTGKAIAKLDPTWEDSESGERILAGYGRGFYCVEHEVSFSPLQLVGLEAGLVGSETAYPRGEAFKEAYRRLREEYDAPLPKWRATLLEHVAVLPPSVRLLDDELSANPRETLADAREQTEALIRDAVGVRDHAQLITAPPGAGKSYGFVATSDDEPGAYLTERNDLKAQGENYAAEIAADDEHHPDAEPSVAHLPILAENRLSDEVRKAGAAAVREHGRGLLHDPNALLEHVEAHLTGDDEVEDDDTVDLQRPTCGVAEGHHGDAWQVRLQVAHELRHKPAEIHRRDEALFGEKIPCHHNGDCELSLGWERIRDPDNPVDLLIGAPQHAYVDSVTTQCTRDGDEGVVADTRAVAIDEFPEDAYVSTYDERFMDHTTWLAEALVDVDSREALLAADLVNDTWVDLWLDGDGAEYGAAADTLAAIEAASALADAATSAANLLDDDRVAEIEEHTSASVCCLREALETLADTAPTDEDSLGSVADRLDTVVNRLRKDADVAYADGRDAAGPLYALADDLEDVLADLTQGLDTVDHDGGGLLTALQKRIDALPVGGDLRALLEDAVDATRGEAPDGLLDAAATALRGGRDGCRELALFATDGYAHPDAWALLAGAIANAEYGSVREVRQPNFGFDGEAEGGVFKRTERNGATIVADKNHHGALVVDPPDFTDTNGRKCPLLGLDATGRPELWRHAIGRDVQQRDIHDTDAERRRFLREAVGLRVVQTTDRPLPYHGTPDGKSFQEDLELVETVAEEYTGDETSAIDEKGPAVMSTKKVLSYLIGELGPHAGATVNYEAMKGSDALADHQVAVLLGSQHYGDTVPEKWALIAGEAADRGETRGAALDYDSDVANAYLRHMREDHIMQAALRVGRNDADTVVFAHTSALRDDLPVVGEGAVVSAHSQGTLAIAEAAADLRGDTFTARDITEAIADDDRGVGLRQVQNVLATLREAGYLRTLEEPTPGRAGEYELTDDPGRADVDLPDLDVDSVATQSEIPRNEQLYTWNFALGLNCGANKARPPSSTAVIPAGDTDTEVIATDGPPG